MLGPGDARTKRRSCAAHPPQELKPDDPYAAVVDDQDRTCSPRAARGDADGRDLLVPVGGRTGPDRPAPRGLRRVVARQGVADVGPRPRQDLRPGREGAGQQEDRALRPTRRRRERGQHRRPGAARAGRGPRAGRRSAKWPRCGSSWHAASSCPAPNTSWRRACGPSSSRRCSRACSRRSTRATRAGARRRATPAAEQAPKLKKNVPYKVSKQLVELFGSARDDVLELAALARRRPPRRQPHRPACCAATSRPRPPSSCGRAARSPTATRRPPTTCAAWPQLRAAARAAALRAQRGLLPAAREGRHRDWEDRVGVSRAGVSRRAGVSCLVAPRGRHGARLFSSGSHTSALRAGAAIDAGPAAAATAPAAGPSSPRDGRAAC